MGVVIEKSNGKIKEGKLTFGGVAPIPWIDDELNNKLAGLNLNENSIMKFSKEVMNNAEPLEHNGFKVKLV